MIDCVTMMLRAVMSELFGVKSSVCVCVRVLIVGLMGRFVVGVIATLLSCHKVVSVNEDRSQPELNYS